MLVAAAFDRLNCGWWKEYDDDDEAEVEEECDDDDEATGVGRGACMRGCCANGVSGAVIADR